MSKETIAKIAEGRVWTGENALEIGLVDQLGGVDVAIDKAVELLGLSSNDVSVKNYPAADTGFESILKQFNEDATLRISDYVLGVDRYTFDFVGRLKREDQIQARCLYQIVL